LTRRGAAGPQRAARRDVTRRPAPPPGARLRPARGVAPAPVPGAARDDGAVAGVRPDRALLRRPRAARLLLPRELVDLARHHDPVQDAPRRASTPRRVLRPAGHGFAAPGPLRLRGFRRSPAPPAATGRERHDRLRGSAAPRPWRLSPPA